MPIATEMSTTAHMYRQNGANLNRCIEGLTTEEWLSRPNDTSNSLMWIVGHTVWARSRALGLLGSTWFRPWLAQFARGAKPIDSTGYPSPDEMALAWKDVSGCLTTALEEAPAEVLNAPAGEKSPSFDGKIGGMVSFLASHEAYHVGQAAYVRCWLGHGGING